MNNNGKFGKSLFGFNRNDVIDFIENMAADAEKILNERDVTIEELKQTIAEKDQAIANAQKQNSELNEKIKSVEAEILQLREIAEKFRDEINSRSAMNERIGEVYVEAKESAERLIQKAARSADEIVKSANFCAEKTLDNISGAQADIINAKQKLISMATDFEKKLDSISESIKSAKSHISAADFSGKKEITEDELESRLILPDKH